ncbi:MAG: DUF5522 domain-containing protein [Saprospiraceae bacterium]
MAKDKKPDTPQQPLVENLDFYLENGFVVFTEQFLRKRGYCCQSGCRHCPYGFVKKS